MALANGSDTVDGGASTSDAAASPKHQTAKRKTVKPAKRIVTQSTIGFPYRDLEVGISVAQAMIGAGGVALSNDQLAGVMNLQAGSGNFVLKVMTARQFGIVSNVGAGKYELTDIGFAIVDKDEKRAKAARAQAFMAVPLYRKTYEEFKGRQLPPRPTGLEQAFVRFGVSPKQAMAARQAFDKSAAQAGYFAAGNERLIEPIIPNSGRPTAYVDEIDLKPDNEKSAAPTAAAAMENAFANLGRHPFIQGLLDTLPEPNTNWTVEGRAKWLQAAANIFDLIYKGTGEIQITAKDPAPKS